MWLGHHFQSEKVKGQGHRERWHNVAPPAQLVTFSITLGWWLSSQKSTWTYSDPRQSGLRLYCRRSVSYHGESSNSSLAMPAPMIALVLQKFAQLLELLHRFTCSLCSVVVRVLKVRSTADRFDSRPPSSRVQPLAGCSHTCTSVTKQYNLVPVSK